jgi:hypothetical protein
LDVTPSDTVGRRLSGIDDCRLIDFPVIADPRGNLTFVEGGNHVDVVLDDGRGRTLVTLNRSYFGLYVPPLIWREIENFSSGAVCLVLASRVYDEADYYRDYAGFVAAVGDGRSGDPRSA